MKWAILHSGSFHQLSNWLAQCRGEGDVTDRSVKPDVEHLSRRVGIVERDRDTPVQIAGHRPFGQSLLDLAQHEVEHALTPRGLTVARKTLGFEPLAQRLFELAQPQVPVGRFSWLGTGARDRALGLDQLHRLDGLAARLALISKGLGIAARLAVVTPVVAGALYVAVGEKLIGLRVVELLGRALDEVTLVVNRAEELLADLLVPRDEIGVMRSAPDVEFDAQSREVGKLSRVVVRGQLRDGPPLFACRDQRGHTVVVAAADEAHLVATRAQVAHERVRGEIGSGDVTDV